MPRDQSKPTKSQIKFLKRIQKDGPVMQTRYLDQRSTYSLVGNGKDLGQDAVENAIRRRWIIGVSSGLLPDSDQLYQVSDSLEL